MSPWRLEVARLWRTRRLVVLAGAYLILGLGIPVLTNYLPSIVAHSNTGGLKLVVPRQTPVDALVGFGQNAGQLGTLAVIVVAAAGLALDARPALAAFYRTRARSGSRLLLPRYVTTAAAAAVCFGLGTLAAWYETSVLIGPLNAGTLAGGFGIETAWICFCVSVVALWAAVVRGVSAIAGLSLASLLALVFLSGIPDLSSWSPTGLATSVAELAGPHHSGAPWHALGVTAAATVVLLATATRRLSTRTR
jgi:ABC-2 type transport system permease protein